MKKMKTLSLLFLAVIMSSTGLVSCIDEDVDPVVESIYRNQALLLASQAALLDAEANYENARAAAENAYAAETAAMTAIAQNSAAMSISEREEVLRKLTADNDNALAQAAITLAQAQLTWERDMAALEAQIAQAGVALANTYLTNYQAAKASAQAQETIKATKQGEWDTASLLANGDGVTWEFYVAQQQSILAGLQAELDMKHIEIASLEAIVADPNSTASYKTELQEAKAAAKAMKDEMDITIVELEADRLPLERRISEWYDNHDDFWNAHNQLPGATSDLEAAEDALEAYEDDLEMYEDMLLTYDEDILALEAAITAAEAAVEAAEAAEAITEAAEDAAEIEEAAKQAVKDAAALALSDLEAVIAGLEGTLNAAAAALAAEQATYDAGIGAAEALVTSTGVAVTDAQNAVAAATVVYETWRDRFEGGPTTNGGYYWEDTTSPSVVLGDDILGMQTDDTGVAVATYVRVETWDYIDNGPVGPDATDEYTPATLGAAQQLSLGAGELAIAGNGTIGALDMLITHPTVSSTQAYFVEVGLDDESSDNLAEFQAATTALGNEDIMDVLPELGDAATGGADAYSMLWDAMLAEIDAIDALANFGVALAAAQEAYDELKAVYENELTLLDAAQQADADAAAELAIAAAAEDDAEAADADADAAVVDANADLDAAELELADYPTVEEIQHEIAAGDYATASLKAVVGAAKVRLEALLAEIELAQAGLDISAERSEETFAELAAIDAEIDAIRLEKKVYKTMEEQYALIIAELDLDIEDIMDMIADCKDDVADLEEDINQQEVIIAAGVIDGAVAEATLEALAAEIANVQEAIDSFEALADKYYALMEAALQS